MHIPRIRKIEAWIVQVPILSEWASSPEFGAFETLPPRLIVRFTDDEGFEGLGECASSASLESILESLRTVLHQAPGSFRFALLDLHPVPTSWHEPAAPSPHFTPHARLKHRIRHPMQTAVEMALCDLICRRAGMPLSAMLGGRWREEVEVDYWMGRVTPEQARRCVRRGKELGFAGVKLKTTLEDPNVERLEAILEEGGSAWSVTVDPNGRFHQFDDALPTILEMDRVGNMTILEDPFPRFDYPAYAALRPRIRARVAAHIDPPESLFTVIASGAAGGLNMDSQAQGLFAWRCQAAVAEAACLPVWHGSGLDLGIATAAQLQLAAATPNCTLAGDQSGPWLRESHLLETGFKLREGKVAVPDGHGGQTSSSAHGGPTGRATPGSR